MILGRDFGILFMILICTTMKPNTSQKIKTGQSSEAVHPALKLAPPAPGTKLAVSEDGVTRLFVF